MTKFEDLAKERGVDLAKERERGKQQIINRETIKPISTSSGGGSSNSSKGMVTKKGDGGSFAGTGASGSWGDTPTPTSSGRVQSAWEVTQNEWNNQNWFNKAYSKLDYGLFGWLPGGLSRDRVVAMDTELSNKDAQLLSAANATKAQVRNQNREIIAQDKITEDYSKKSWFEYLGIGYPQEEKDYQAQLDTLRNQAALGSLQPGGSTNTLIRDFGSNLGGGFVQGATDAAKPATNNWGNYALIGAAAILLFMVVKKK